MARYGIVCDVSKCCGCYSCFLACKDEFIGKEHLPYSTAFAELSSGLKLHEVEYGTEEKVKTDFVAVMCQHCVDPACASDAPEGAVTRRPDGIVLFDPVKAKGAQQLVENCPYHCITWNEALNLPQKCTLCAHMLDAGEKETRCTECCPTGALTFGDLDDPESEIAKLMAAREKELEIYRPEFGQTPAVRYLNLPKPFVCGSLALADTDACAAGAKVRLRCKDTGAVYEAEADFLGDFEIKGLGENRACTLSVEYPGYQPTKMDLRTNASKNLGLIILQRE
jgi:Fe-S-cluster-containing dehydrogenase component